VSWLELDRIGDVVELFGGDAGFLIEIDEAHAPALGVGSIRVFIDRVFAGPSEWRWGFSFWVIDLIRRVVCMRR
jgi:hypothetical protein